MTDQLEQSEPGQKVMPVPPLRSEDGIWRLAMALSAAASPLDVARALAEEGAVVAGASFSNMAVLDATTKQVTVVHRSGIDPDIAERWGEFDLAEPTPLCEAMRTGLPVLVESVEHMSRRFPEMVPDTVAASLSANVSLPLFTPGGAILGAVGFGWPSAQEFGVEQLRTLDLISNLAAQSLDRAVLYQNERQRSSTRERADALLFQDAFLPRELPHTATLDVAAVHLPASYAAMGGDWYDVFPVEGGTCLVIGDVAGHGVQSAAVMGQLRNTIRAYAFEDPSPARVLTRLNQMMCHLDPGEHATATVAVWDERNGTLLRSNAGHPPVLRCRAGEFGYLIPPQGRLLGVTPDWDYQEETKILRPGTTMLFYSDGLIEWRGQSIDDGMNGLLAFVEKLDDLSPQAVCDQVLAWRLRTARQEDDVCVLAARLK